MGAMSAGVAARPGAAVDFHWFSQSLPSDPAASVPFSETEYAG
jgi:hypothetical protein